jgi:hypothetical protein
MTRAHSTRRAAAWLRARGVAELNAAAAREASGGDLIYVIGQEPPQVLFTPTRPQGPFGPQYE